MRNKIWFWLGVGVLLMFIQCLTVNQYRIGKEYMEMENYDAAIESFKTGLQTDPDNVELKRELGIAHYLKPDIPGAIPILLEAFLADTTDGRTIFYLGTAYEHIGKTKFAIDMYRRYTEVSKTDQIRKSIENRLEQLIQKQMRQEALNALANESQITTDDLPDQTIAVLYFKNLGKTRKLDPVQKGLVDMVITDLSQVNSLDVVERARLQKLLREMELGQTGIVDASTAPRVGKLLGASRIVQGSFLELSRNRLRIDAGVASLKSSQKSRNKRVQGDLGKFYRLEKDLVFQVIDQMNIDLTQAERDAIEIIPTENLLAFMAYCKGLDLDDQGKFEEAASAYQEALDLDPNFKKAAEHQSFSEQLATPVMEIGQIERMVRSEYQTAEAASPNAYAKSSTASSQSAESGESDSAETPSTTDAAPGKTVQTDVTSITSSVKDSPLTQPVVPNVLINQMVHTASVLDQVFLPGLDSREPNQEQQASSFGSTPEFRIQIALPENDR